ncbi:MAG: aspartate kinase, partial [Bdellovibrionaceae bacterium]|nr:aspartate kinase [Pseudobdellovibrionaceae bacterium]
VLAGFQGVSEKEKEVTTLGRGGSDTTAVAMAAHFKSVICDFKKDVGGVFSADPKLVPNAQHLPELNYKHLMDMTFWGGKVLHYRAAELAGNLSIPLRLSHFEKPHEKTLVHGEKIMIEEQKILSINSHKTVHRIFFAKADQTQLVQMFFNSYKQKEQPYPQLLSAQSTDTQTCLLVVGEGSSADYKALGATHFEELSSITMTCHGAVASDLVPQVMKCVAGNTVHDVLQDSTNLTLIVDPKNRATLIQKLHTLIEA